MMPVLPSDAAVSIVASATSWEIDVEVQLFGIYYFSVRPSNSNQAEIILAASGKGHSQSFQWNRFVLPWSSSLAGTPIARFMNI